MHANSFYLFYMMAFVAPACSGRLQTISSDQELIRSKTLTVRVVHLLKYINSEYPYDHIVFLKETTTGSDDCIFEDSIVYIDKPIIIIHNLNDGNLVQSEHSREFLLVTCSYRYLERFNIRNTVFQYAPHVVWLEEGEPNIEMQNFCYKIHDSGYFRNLIVTPQSLSGDSNYLTCDFQKNLKQLTRQQLFAHPFHNMQGVTLTTASDQLAPRSILFYDDSGQLQLIGFVANYLITFAKRYNATLKIMPPVDMGVTEHFDFIANKTFQGMLDIAAVVAPYKVDILAESYSYPVELMEYCYMIPLPHIRPAYKVYFEIIEMKAILIILIYFILFSIFLSIEEDTDTKYLNVAKMVLNDKSMRGLLGQSFIMPRRMSFFRKYILFLLCYSSILLSTSYEAYLQSHLIHPPLEKRMKTYEDIRRNNIKILIDERESVHIRADILDLYKDLFLREENFYKFLKLRESMDIRYVFPVSYNRWSVFQERQKLFQRKLFYYSSQLCLNHLLLLSFPLRPGLPYKLQFNQHLLDIRDSGLLDCWLKHNFLIMVRLKLFSFKDLSVVDDYGLRLNLDDLLWIWISYAACISLSCLAFAMELLLNKIKWKAWK